MKKRIYFIAATALIFLAVNSYAQEGIIYRFSDGVVPAGWSQSANYMLSVEEGSLRMDCEKSLWEGISFNIPELDFSDHPYVSMDLMADEDVAVMVYVYDKDGLRNAASKYIPASDRFETVVYDFRDMTTTYAWNNVYLGEVDFSAIISLNFTFNAGGKYEGTVIMDNLAIGDSAVVPTLHSGEGPWLDTLNIIIDPDSIAALDTHPLTDEDVYGKFQDPTGHIYIPAELHYRGASNLLGLINSGRPQRNWKVKAPKSDMYRNRREWNFNFSEHVRQEMSYHLFREADVPVIGTRHVNLNVNGERSGLFLEYEDPDNKPWLLETFGDDHGDLYKAALDIPGYPSYFAELTYLGPKSSDYFNHYRKKTNHKSAPEDYTSIRDLVVLINFTPNDAFIDSLDKHFDTDRFLSYLVVSNFIGNWDGYPHRGKNYWLYQNLSDGGKFSFIPWDLDNTLAIQVHDWNQMGVEGDLYYQFFETVWAGHNGAEVADRPLVRRMMKFAEYRNGYINRYKELLSNLMVEEKLFAALDSLDELVRSNSDNLEYQMFHNTVTTTKVFCHQRTRYVASVLDTISYIDTLAVTDFVPDYPDLTVSVDPGSVSSFRLGDLYPNPASDFAILDMFIEEAGQVELSLFDLEGRKIESVMSGTYSPGSYQFRIETSMLRGGLYLLRLKHPEGTEVRKLLVR